MPKVRGSLFLVLMVFGSLSSLVAGCGSTESESPGDEYSDANDDGAEMDDDDSAAGDDDSAAGDDDSAAGDDDSAAGDDDSEAGDDDSEAGDDDSEAGDDDSEAGDDDSASIDDDTDLPLGCPSWTFDGDAGAWTLANGLTLSATQEVGSVHLDSGADPHLWIETSADLSTCTLIDVVLKVTGDHGPWQLFWQRQQDAGFAEARSRQFNQFADGDWFRYVFDLADHPEWDGTLSWLRLDPHVGPGTVAIASIALVEPQGQFPPPLDLSQVQWLHTNVTAWPQTSTLSSVTVNPSTICLDHDQASSWTAVNIAPGVDVNANPWVFIWRPDLAGSSGTWYGATWEWMRPNQACKQRYAVAGDHIKRDPYHITSGWAPSPGETLHFMVSGLARGVERNQEERSNVVQITWP